MEDIHRKVLRKNGPFLIKEVMLEPLWPHLLARDIFTDQMVDHIQATGAKSSQMHRLLSDLCKRGPNAYSEFIECLVDTEQQHIVDKLNATEETLTNKEPKFFTPPVMSSTTIGYNLGESSSSSSIGHSSAPTRQIPREIPNGHYSAPTHAAAANHSLLRFSAAPSSTNQMGVHNETTKKSRVAYERSSSVSTTAPSHDISNEIVSLEQQHPGPSKTASLMETLTTCPTSVSTNSISVSKPSLPFTVSSQFDNHDNEITPNRNTGVGSSADRVRRNLTSLLRSPVTQTDNGDGVTLASQVCAQPIGVQSTDHPQAIDINPYPQVLGVAGIPETSGRLNFSVLGSQKRIMPDWDTMYKMTSDPRGYCIIINNRHFTGHLKERLGTDVDRDNLYMLYSQLGYQICIQENLTGMEMLLTLRDFAQLAHHKSVDSCVVILLTHGLDGQIYGSDAKLINLSEVFNFFDGNVCPGLQGKPKFFLVQACRGDRFDAGFDLPDNGQTDTAGPASQAIIDIQQQGINDMNTLSQKLPSGSDFLIAYATVPGFVSWRNSEQGSWFIQAMCEIFAKHSHHEDAVNMLVQVNNRVASIYESATKHKQMPSPVVLLRKKLFFLPLN